MQEPNKMLHVSYKYYTKHKLALRFSCFILLFRCDLTFLDSLDMNVEVDFGVNSDTDCNIKTHLLK